MMSSIQFSGIYKVCIWRNPEKGYNNTDELNTNGYDANYVLMKKMSDDAKQEGRNIQFVNDDKNYYWFEDDLLGNDASNFNIRKLFPDGSNISSAVENTPHKLDVLVEDNVYNQLHYQVMDKAWGKAARQLLNIKA